MIKSFLFENFKSFDKAKFDLESLTILIGSNASGKSNAIKALNNFGNIYRRNSLLFLMVLKCR